MRRITTIVLLCTFAATGSGLLRYLHLLEHLGEQAQRGQGQALVVPDGEGHDEHNCATCMNLQIPLSAAGYTPVLISLGLIVAFLSILAPPLVSQRNLASIDCRGPPVL